METETTQPEPTIDLLAEKRLRLQNAYFQFVIDAKENGERFVGVGPILSPNLDGLRYQIRHENGTRSELLISGLGENVYLQWRDHEEKFHTDLYISFLSTYNAEEDHVALQARLQELAGRG